MCPISDSSEEVENVLTEEEEAEVVSEAKAAVSEEADSATEEEVVAVPDEDKEFEGVDRIEDIPKGKEKNYGI